MLGDPPVDDTHCVDCLEAHLPAGSRNTEEVAEVGSVINPIGHDHITVGLAAQPAMLVLAVEVLNSFKC